MIVYFLLLTITAFFAYASASLSTQAIAGRYLFRRNLRRLGQGNTWVSNFWRLFKLSGAVKLTLLEIVKAALPILLGWLLLSLKGKGAAGMAFAGFCVVMGRLWPVFNRFRGCHACVALAVAGLFANPSVGIAAAVVCAGVVWFSRYLTLGAVAEALIVVVTSVLVVDDALVSRLLMAAAALVILRHIPLLLRLNQGKEERLSFREDLTYKLDQKF